MWIQPKVDWQTVDYFNIEDWQRICDNLSYLYLWMLNRGLIPSISPKNLTETELSHSYEELPYVSLVNNLENNLASLQETLGLNITKDVAQKTWYERLDILYSENPSCEDWNRWENILLRVFESMQYIGNYMYTPICGTCYSGSERTLIRFSRGR